MSGGNSTGGHGKVLRVTRDQLNELMILAFNLTECCAHPSIDRVRKHVRILMLESVDKLAQMCETWNDHLLVCVPRAKGQPEPVATFKHPREAYNDEEWEALMGEGPPPARQLSFYDGHRSPKA